MAGLLWPIAGDPITTQHFDGDDPLEPALFLALDVNRPRRARGRRFPNALRFAHLHGAIDIKCKVGTPVLAPEAGRIVEAGIYDSTKERFMMLRIKPGTVLFFTHLDSFTAHEGDDVLRGAEIARSGETGKAKGPHLHWEVRITRRRHPRPRRSGRWFKWNPQRLRVGHDLADLPAIQPPHELMHLVGGAVDIAEVEHEVEADLAGQPMNVDGALAADLEPEDEALDDEADGEDDEFGDAALAAELGVAPVQPIGGPLEF